LKIHTYNYYVTTSHKSQAYNNYAVYEIDLPFLTTTEPANTNYTYTKQIKHQGN